MNKAKNHIQIIGNLGSVPSTGEAGNGTPFLYFSLAEDAGNKLKDGQKIKKTRWHDCVAWGESLVNLLKDLRKGERLLITGQLDYDIKNIDGKDRKLAKIIIHEFVYMDPKAA